MEDKWPSVRNPPTNSELELFTRELTWDTRRTLSKVYAPMWMGGMGFVLACATNWFNRKPMLSGRLLRINLNFLPIYHFFVIMVDFTRNPKAYCFHCDWNTA